jgi:glycosyltransferase involved in cell wall biosynthesis
LLSPEASPIDPDVTAKIGDVAAAAGLRRVHMLAWRDLNDVEAGGSEVHAARVAQRWAAAGIEVTMRTSYAQGSTPEGERDGYRVIRRAGRYLVFPRAAFSEATGRHGSRDGLVEIWNGMPFVSPLWARGPRIVFLHHFHGAMWRMVLPPRLARLGEVMERRVAPPLYRRTKIVTLSESSRDELIAEMGLRADRIDVVPPGIDDAFSPAPDERSPTPLVVAVGRLVPVKRFDMLIQAFARIRDQHPEARLVIVGEGYERADLEALVRSLGIEESVSLAGRVSDDDLISLYRRAWAVASASSREGWGMTLTEAAACGTPSVATRIPGHIDAVSAGRSGLLVDDEPGLVSGLRQVIDDSALRDRLQAGALEHAAGFTWDRTALETLEALAAEARPRR